METAHLDWKAACDHGNRFLPYLQESEPQYVEEMHGVANGAGVSFESILVLNVRTEIVYGLSKDDGCTAISWQNEEALLAQTWDWRPAQRPNLIQLTIRKPDHQICMITEGGIIGKIGINSRGIGVCLNAIRAFGVTYTKLPVHLALRKILDHQGSLHKVVEQIKACGVASSAHILTASMDAAYGIETTHQDVVLLQPQVLALGHIILHTNHLLAKHDRVDERLELQDSIPRLVRANQLIQAHTGSPSIAKLKEILKDEEGYPVGICRDVAPTGGSSTLFSIVMDLKDKRGYVKIGRPVGDGEDIVLDASMAQ